MSIRIEILLVEDDDISAQAARTLLERLGCDVDHVNNGAEAIELRVPAAGLAHGPHRRPLDRLATGGADQQMTGRLDDGGAG